MERFKKHSNIPKSVSSELASKTLNLFTFGMERFYSIPIKTSKMQWLTSPDLKIQSFLIARKL